MWRFGIGYLSFREISSAALIPTNQDGDEMKMIKKIHLPALSAILLLVLVSCRLTASPSATDSSLPIIEATPSLAELVTIELTVIADTSVPFNTVGQIIKFSYVIKAVRNSSSDVPANITVTGATVTCPALNTLGNLNDRLDQDEAIVCTSDYVITQADLDRGSVINIAIANVYTVNSNQVTTTLPVIPAKALTLTKTVDPVTYDRAGQQIKYNYVIKNSGSSPLGPPQFIVTDPGIGAPINCGEATLTLASTAIVACSAIYTVTQADMAAVSVSTAATASGGGVGSSQPASATITKSTVVVPVNPNSANLTAGSTIKHTVVTGEWLWQIARCYGANPVVVRDANQPNPGRIFEGTIVTVPNIGSAGRIYGKPCIEKYIVLSGDTWNTIAQKKNVDLTVLQMANSYTLTVGREIVIPLYSVGAVTTTPSNTATGNCVDLTRNLKLAGVDAKITHFNFCGTAVTAAPGNMKISTIKVSQRPEDVGLGGLLQDISVSVDTSTAINDANSFIVGDMNYDGNDDFRIVKFLPAGPNIPYLYYIYDPATRNFVYSSAYENITSPEFPGNSEIRSQWRESAAKWGIDTYTISDNAPRLIKRETWEALNATPQAKHVITVFNVDGTSQVTVDEIVPLPAQ